MLTTQDDVFGKSEGDAWFQRNVACLSDVDHPDRMLDILSRLDEREGINSVCEVGCAHGWRLARLPEALPNVQRRAGFDLSAAAIEDGMRRCPELELRVGGASAPPFHEQFDLVIVNFVLHWVDRSLLLKTLAAVDDLVAPGGWLAVGDFLPDSPCRRRYHHRPDVELYTYKQDYSAAFTATGLYREVSRSVHHHADTGHGLQAADAGDRAVCVLLHKPVQAYAEQRG
ncbi:class I SAM-dependent methyltransferase [Viridibacterium curvum]|uniref:Methyltransferase domain-containing protein n=1 Tax=Viridibacterium curvum TaxID=1101404 RepID=A0ABP9QAT7_9RHOO